MRRADEKLFDYLDNIFVLKAMITAHLLWLMLCRTSPHHRIFELFEDGAMNLITKVFAGILAIPQYNGISKWRKGDINHTPALRVVRKLSFWFGVDARQIQPLPHLPPSHITLNTRNHQNALPWPINHRNSTRDEQRVECSWES